MAGANWPVPTTATAGASFPFPEPVVPATDAHAGHKNEQYTNCPHAVTCARPVPVLQQENQFHTFYTARMACSAVSPTDCDALHGLTGPSAVNLRHYLLRSGLPPRPRTPSRSVW